MASHDKPSAEVAEHHEASIPDAPSKDLASDAAAKGQGITGYETLGVWKTVMAFKMNSLICFLVTFSAATDGYQIAYLVHLSDHGTAANLTNDKGETVLASSSISTWAAIGSVGQIVGMTTLPFLSDKYGRKIAMYWYWLLLAISVAIEGIAQDWKVWLVAKLFGGIGVGCLQSTIPTYVSEVAPIRVRGAFLMCYSLWWITGQFFGPLTLQVMSTYDAKNYLTPVYTQWTQIGLMIIIYLLIPESPAWCASRGKAERAKKGLQFIYKGVKDFDVEHQYNLLVLTVDHERTVAAEQRSEKWYAIFKGNNGLRTLISCWTLMAQQFIGLGVFFTTGTYFFQQVGIKDPFKVTCITSGINIAFSILVIFLADLSGRRWMACSGTTICWACNIAVGILGVVPQVKATEILIIFFCLSLE
ncbi:hypothetical protein NW757_011107 [Fusarium falciforme]|nr:hypothetical protein NW757_011107 [Fusarium falciforme]